MNVWYVRGNLPDAAAAMFERFPKLPSHGNSA
jgi:hypothetical protein